MLRRIILTLSKKLSTFCFQYGNITDAKKRTEVEYGAYFLVMTVLSAPFLYIPAIILGILPQVLFTSCLWQLCRFSCGGFHIKSHLGCYVGGNFIMGYLPGILIKYTDIFENVYVIFGLYMMAFVLILHYAPADVASKPVKTFAQRYKLRNLAMTTFSIAIILTVITMVYSIKSDFLTLIPVVLFLETLTMLPIAYKMFKREYGAGYGVTRFKGGNAHEKQV